MGVEVVNQADKYAYHNKIQLNEAEDLQAKGRVQTTLSHKAEYRQEESQAEAELKEERKNKLLEEIRKEISGIQNEHTQLEFGIHDATNQITIKIIDSKTSKVIKEIPSEKILDMMGRLLELSGLIIDEKR